MFQTFGLVDTIMILQDNCGNDIQYDYDSGYGFNSLISINLEKDIEYIIIVKGVGENTAGHTRLMISETNGYYSDSISLNRLQFENFESVTTYNYYFTSYHEEHYSKGFRFVPQTSSISTITIYSSFRNYLYVFNPYSGLEMEEDVEYCESDDSGTASIKLPFEAYTPYFIVIAQLNPNETITNNKCMVSIS